MFTKVRAIFNRNYSLREDFLPILLFNHVFSGEKNIFISGFFNKSFSSAVKLKEYLPSLNGVLFSVLKSLYQSQLSLKDSIPKSWPQSRLLEKLLIVSTVLLDFRLIQAISRRWAMERASLDLFSVPCKFFNNTAVVADSANRVETAIETKRIFWDAKKNDSASKYYIMAKIGCMGKRPGVPVVGTGFRFWRRIESEFRTRKQGSRESDPTVLLPLFVNFKFWKGCQRRCVLRGIARSNFGSWSRSNLMNTKYCNIINMY